MTINSRSQKMTSIDLSPKEIAQKTISIGKAKAEKNFSTLLILSMFAGIFIGFGGIFSTIVLTEGNEMPFGVGKLLAGIVFSVGLILVVVCGAELFTGNNLIVLSWLKKEISFLKFIRNLTIVYIGNFLGSLFLVGLMFLSKQYLFNNGLVGKKALDIALSKSSLDFWQAVALGVLCNIVVCLAVWASFGAKTFASKVAVIVPIIAMFIAAGFEHCVANMYFLPLGWVIKSFAPNTFWQMIESSAGKYVGINWNSILFGNLLPVTIGNIIGGVVFVGIGYWLVYGKEK